LTLRSDVFGYLFCSSYSHFVLHRTQKAVFLVKIYDRSLITVKNVVVYIVGPRLSARLLVSHGWTVIGFAASDQSTESD
jgi:hypothetical protein